MAFLDKLEQAASKVGSAAADAFDYSKAKGKIVAEKSKLKDAKEDLGAYVYETRLLGQELCESKLITLCGAIQEHVEEIAKLEAEAKEAGDDVKGVFGAKND